MSRRQPARADRDAAAGDERVKEEDGSRALVVVLRVLGRLIVGHSLNHKALRMPACPRPGFLLPLICRGLPHQSINQSTFTIRLVSPTITDPPPILYSFTCTRNKMPHFPQPSQEVSETMTLPTRERESEHSDSRRPQPPVANDNENAQRASRLRVQNRRRRYLELNPEYLSGSNLEQAGL
jgi:hypothetical protein